MKGHSLETKLLCTGSPGDLHGASVPPLYQTTTFKVRSLDDAPDYDYTRSGNPTRTSLESQLGKLYDVDESQACAVSTGMSALDVILRTILNNRGEVPTVITGDDLYGGTQRLLSFLAKQNHARVIHVDTSDTGRFFDVYQMQRGVACVLLETPTNPLMKVADLPTLIQFVKERDDGCKVVVDNTMLSGVNCNPLLLGADYVYESATKYLNGHHDIMAGVIIAATASLAQEVKFVTNSIGAGLAPLDSWLLIRGLKTLSLRLKQQEYNAMVLAHWLQDICGFKPVGENRNLCTRYVGLKSHPQFQLHRTFSNGPGAVLSIETGDIRLSEKVVCYPQFKIWAVTVSFGCVNSLISMPCKMSHASIDPLLRKERQFPEDLIRLCCGIEDISDLQWDLLASFENAGIIELRDDGNTVVNRLNGHIAKNTVASNTRASVYDIYFNSKNTGCCNSPV
ncbi:HEL254Cp [Eremothecium sinecaudum]|uniref:cysteine-S-conjugate beta-lyase n=1 Tax=Eremothecium sinecaudum TaxID=45286 RepID=A0A0X8HT80_9SACH|nr:HEL254Cp [Eremothecium sinecaudum]AMD21027.1 HEL254Cp [Eremothecium sinecaudum]